MNDNDDFLFSGMASDVDVEFDEYLHASAQERADRLADFDDLPEPLRWKLAVTAGGCIVKSDECGGPIEGHHAITQASLRRRGFTHMLWDHRNGVALCHRHHARHTRGLERVPYSCLPQRVIEFADEVGLGWQLERYYPQAPGLCEVCGRRPGEIAVDGTWTCPPCDAVLETLGDAA